MAELSRLGQPDQSGWTTLDRIGAAARKAREYISPWGVVSPTDVAGFAPGGGLVQAWQDSGRGLANLKAGNYGQAAADYGSMALNTAGEFVPLAKMAMFLGPMAKTADLDLLKSAKTLAEKGADARKIWDETGWFQGADGKWRFEVPDNASAFTLKDTGGSDVPLGSVLDHRQVFDAYPQAADVPTVVRQTRDIRGGHYMGGEMQGMELRAPNVSDGRSVALHETQHLIQDMEGFSHGGNSFALKPGTPAWDIYLERRALMEKSARENGMKEIPSWIDVEAQKAAAQEAYRRLAGEVESRNVQKRMDMQPWERRENPPWTTEDVPRDQQIVRYR